MHWRGAVVVVGLALALGVPSQASARRAKPQQVVPAKKKARGWPAPSVDTSEGGRKSGALEITLGSLTVVLAGVLIGRGVWELRNAKRLEDACAAGTSLDQACTTWDRPGRPGRISAGLSFALAVPVGVASGLLLARGIRVRRDHRKWHRAHDVALRAAVAERSFGLAIGGRF